MPAQTIGIPPTVPQRVSLAIGNASKRTGVPFDYLMAQARVESSLDPEAQANSSSAAGLFQFTKQTWLATLSQHGANHGLQWAADAIRKGADGQYRVVDPQMREQILGLRFDPDVSSTMAAEFADDNADMLRNRFGEEPEPVDLYLAHFLGAQGAADLKTVARRQPPAEHQTVIGGFQQLVETGIDQIKVARAVGQFAAQRLAHAAIQIERVAGQIEDAEGQRRAIVARRAQLDRPAL
jgi:hypothetical protein